MARLPASEIDAVEQRLISPLAWAGYRFVGAWERRPLVVGPIAFPPLDAEQEVELEGVVSGPAPAEKDVDAHQTYALLEAIEAVAGRGPTAHEAVAVARLYANRRRASPRHNHLRGLAWLHEVLATPGLEPDTERRLSVEAAWMWLEVGRRDTTDERLLGLFPSDRVAVARAATLVSGLEPTADVVVLRAWIGVFGREDRRPELVARKAWSEVRGQASAITGDGYADLRRRRAVLELALCCKEMPADAADVATIGLDGVGNDSIELHFALHRWELTRTVVLRRLGLGGGDGFDIQYLPHRDLPRAIELRMHGRDDGDPNWSHFLNELNDGLALVEYHYWGEPSDNRGTFWGTTGSPSRAWQFTGGTFLAHQVRNREGATRVTHHLSCLQLSADLRVAPLNAWCRALGRLEDHPMGRLGRDVWAIEHMLRFLSDAATLPDIGETGGLSLTPRPAFDPFARSPDELATAAEQSPLAATAWMVATAAEDWFNIELSGRTAAFQVELLVSGLQKNASRWWELIRESVDGELREELHEQGASAGIDALHELLDPDAEIRLVEARLRELPEWCVVLGLSVAGTGELVSLALWRDGKELRERSHVTSSGTGIKVAAHLAEVLKPRPDDCSPQHGRAGERSRAWASLLATLEPILGEVLGPAVSRERHLRIFAPGTLRSLPALGLTIGGAPLWTQFASVSLLPSLGFERRVPARGNAHPFTVCTLAAEHDQGETRFGEASIGTLRRWYPPEVVAEATRPVGRDIVEADAIQGVHEQANVVRFYGVGHPWALNHSTAGLSLPGGRAFTLASTRRMTLPEAAAVEIWAAVGGSSEMTSTMAFDGDSLPALVRSFLMNGAAGVLDIAWPAHDLVKAMVAECFGAVRRLGPLWEPVALVRAVGWVSQTLAVWREESAGFTTKAEALRWLDMSRMMAAQKAHLDPRAVIRFEPLADAPSLPGGVRELVEEVCQPVHLAAFRWWGA